MDLHLLSMYFSFTPSLPKRDPTSDTALSVCLSSLSLSLSLSLFSLYLALSHSLVLPLRCSIDRGRLGVYRRQGGYRRQGCLHKDACDIRKRAGIPEFNPDARPSTVALKMTVCLSRRSQKLLEVKTLYDEIDRKLYTKNHEKTLNLTNPNNPTKPQKP